MSELLLSLCNYSVATCFSEDIPESQPARGTAIVRISEQMADSAQSRGPTLCLCNQHKISCWDWSQPSLASLNKITFLLWMPTRRCLCNRHASNRTLSPKMLYKKDDAVQHSSTFLKKQYIQLWFCLKFWKRSLIIWQW